MIAWLNPIVGERLAKPVFFGGLVLLILAGFGLWLKLHDRRVVENHSARQEAAARPADAKAAADRVVITQTIANDAEEAHNAVDKLPDAPLTDRQRARACAVWVRQHPGTDFPAAR
ncbi:hypothetical protein CA234_09770 [Sphingomonas sp. ABOLE]|uniref:hypothetical protein n=1 Tax=Sphingomonas sp. ABOLE TaxID=1985878 RepID=UPI000F7F1687|nr:hypothetical protein [Sphingomonas sp. ABOLE]RSV41544.1 hypothetical protein CA234_09770 [Sphingomonas sp. ABOLE]